MAGGSIKLFQFTQKYCQTFGICPPQPNQNRYNLNLASWCILFFLNQAFMSIVAFLLFEADSMNEFGIKIFACLTILASDIYSLVAYWQVEIIPKFVENWEKFIEKSESHVSHIFSSSENLS